MKHFWKSVVSAAVALAACLLLPATSRAEVKAWEGTITIPTYPWQDDVNPKFWAMEGGPKLSTTVSGSIIYPYTMQDHLSRTKVDRTYKALFLENEYLKVTCLPKLGGRLHSVFDKTEGQEMFHTNDVIKPGMIAMRGAWISGGVEWNSGPHGHTVAILSPVNALVGRNADGSAFLEISNLEKIFRTRWTVRVTLHPGKAYLDERIRIFNPTDGTHPYYFWNCTAFPNRPGTRFIYPMSLGTDHNGREFFDWPVHNGKDLSWLKNYQISSSIFAVGCDYDFFGAYDVDADRGIVQVANHHELPGKKAWTWGQWDFGRVAQQSLSDDGDDGPYIEVQSGPLPTQSDYGMLAPREEVSWREWWYPVHGLGQGFQYATRDLAAEVARTGGNLQLRLIATGRFPGAVCTLSQGPRKLLQERLNLSPQDVREVKLAGVGDSPVDVTVKSSRGKTLASFVTPLPIRKVSPPDPSKFVEKPDDRLTAEQLYLKGRKRDRDTKRSGARAYYQKALEQDPGHLRALVALAVLDLEAGRHRAAVPLLEKAVDRDGDDGWAWYFLGVCQLRLGDNDEALRCGYRASRCTGTTSVGFDLAGRASMRLGRSAEAVETFRKAVRCNPRDPRSQDHLALALYADEPMKAQQLAGQRLARYPMDLIPKMLLTSGHPDGQQRFGRQARSCLGEFEFELLEAAGACAELGLYGQARWILSAGYIDSVPPAQQSPLPRYYAAYYASLQGDQKAAAAQLRRAAEIDRDFVFPSRTRAIDVLQYALKKNPRDANAHFHLGNLLGGLGRLEEAAEHWRKAAELKPGLSVAFRNLGLYAAAQEKDLAKAGALYEKAIKARPDDETLYRDLAEILIADGKRPEAIELLQDMPLKKVRRADATIMLAQAYFDERRHADCIALLESTPYFVNWEGQGVTRALFVKAHMKRGEQNFRDKAFRAALHDFDAALTYPENLGVGRSNRPEEAPARYWRGKTLQAMGRPDQARAAWKAGAEGKGGSSQQDEYRQRCRDALSDKR